MHVMNAALKHDVHIVEKENYDPEKDYDYFLSTYSLFSCGMDLNLLFVFADCHSVLISKDEQVENFVEEYNTLKYAHLMFD